MDILPLDIQDKIWKIYYRDIYQKSLLQIQSIFYEIENFNENIENIKKFLRIIRFSKDKQTIDTTKKNLKIILENYNENIIDLINNKSSKIICSKKDIFIYLIQLVKFQNYYTEIPQKYKLVFAYFNKYCRFQENMFQRLKKSIE
jgi:hypothetical protein